MNDAAAPLAPITSDLLQRVMNHLADCETAHMVTEAVRTGTWTDASVHAYAAELGIELKAV